MAGGLSRHSDPSTHTVGKQHTQKIERKHLTFRTRIKTLDKENHLFFTLYSMHDLVIAYSSIAMLWICCVKAISTKLKHHLIFLAIQA